MASFDFEPAIVAAATARWSIVIDLLQMMPLTLSDSERTLAIDLSLQVLLNGDFEQQWQIAKIIPKLGEFALPPLLKLLNDPEIEIEDRWCIARILGGFKRSAAIAALIELIRQSADPELSAIATGALAQIGTAAIPALVDLLPTADCALAVTALAQIRHSQTIDPLLDTLHHPDPHVRTITIEALSSFHDARIPPLLLPHLSDLAPSVRCAAVSALCLRRDEIECDLIRHLQPLLFDLNLEVCEATALGLARLPDPQVVTVLSEVLASSHTPVKLRSAVIRALGWIGTRSALASLAAGLATAPPASLVEIITSISNTETDRTAASQLLADYLRTNLATSTASVKQEIAVALGNLGDTSSVPELIQLLGDPDNRVKLYTIAAIAKLSPTIPPEILQLVDRSDLTPELQIGVKMYLDRFEARSSSIE